MNRTATGYALKRAVDLSFDVADRKIREELAKEGFGILTEIDVRETLKRKLDVEIPPYVILGACNPSLAHRAIQAEPDIGLLLPCNVVVRKDEPSGRTVVEAMDPAPMIGLSRLRKKAWSSTNSTLRSLPRRSARLYRAPKASGR